MHIEQVQKSKVSTIEFRFSIYFFFYLLYLPIFNGSFFQSSMCSQRLVPCQYCELELVSSQSKEHEDYCGARTEPCPHCKSNVMLREQAMHLVMCESLTIPQERNNSKISCSQAEEPSSDSWLEAHSIRNRLRRQDNDPKNNNINADEHSWFPRLFDPSVYSTSNRRQALADRKNTTPQSTTFSHSESF